MRRMSINSAALDQFRAAAADTLADAGEYVLEESNRTIPIEEGTLQRSGQVTMDRPNLTAVVSYDTPYAVRQHEDTRLRHDPGRRAKWLEATLREQSQRVSEFLADGIKRRTR